MQNDEKVPEQPADSQPFSKADAAKYLGVSVRKLEYAMAKGQVQYEKHGRKVVFRRPQLEIYRQAMIVPGRGTSVPNLWVSAAAATSDSAKARTILAVDLEMVISELRCRARSEHRLTREGAKTVLTKMAGLRDADAEQRLAAYEAAAASAVQKLPSIFGPQAVKRMDWSYAVADAFLIMHRQLEIWIEKGKKPEEPIIFPTPADFFAHRPERMLGCLEFIPLHEFSALLDEAKQFYGAGPNAPLVARTHFQSDSIPFDVIIKPSSESSEKRPRSFVGPTTVEVLKRSIVNRFGIVEAVTILKEEACSLEQIAKLTWQMR